VNFWCQVDRFCPGVYLLALTKSLSEQQVMGGFALDNTYMSYKWWITPNLQLLVSDCEFGGENGNEPTGEIESSVVLGLVWKFEKSQPLKQYNHTNRVWGILVWVEQGEAKFKKYALKDELCLTTAWFVSWPAEGVTWDEKLSDMLRDGVLSTAPTSQQALSLSLSLSLSLCLSVSFCLLLCFLSVCSLCLNSKLFFALWVVTPWRPCMPERVFWGQGHYEFQFSILI